MLNCRRTGIAAVAIALAAGSLAAHAQSPAQPTMYAGDALHQAVVSDTRSAHDRARDIYRHPEQSLAFWGLKPGDTVIDIKPAPGWWTDILAPYLARTGGRYIAADSDLVAPTPGSNRATFVSRYTGNPGVYGKVTIVGFGPKAGPLAPPGTVDLILDSRETHNWVGPFMQQAFAEFYAALKPGGILAIEDHRAAEGADPAKGNGYLPESYVIAQARQAGFKLVARSEINANPKDTKDHPFGVWTLPPTRLSAPFDQPANPAFNHALYDAIGESDRMTLKFVKP